MLLAILCTYYYLMLSFLVNVPDTCTEVNQIMLQVSQSQRRIHKQLQPQRGSAHLLLHYCMKMKEIGQRGWGGGCAFISEDPS